MDIFPEPFPFPEISEIPARIACRAPGKSGSAKLHGKLSFWGQTSSGLSQHRCEGPSLYKGQAEESFLLALPLWRVLSKTPLQGEAKGSEAVEAQY